MTWYVMRRFGEGSWPSIEDLQSMAGLDTGLAANSKQMTPLSDYAEHRLLAARPYSTYVGDYYKFNLTDHSE